VLAIGLMVGHAVFAGPSAHGPQRRRPVSFISRAPLPPPAHPTPVGHGRPIAFEPGACVGFAPHGRWNGKTVFLDPGHGGVDPGATPVVDGRRLAEKGETLGVGLLTRSLLRDQRYRVVMSRVGDSTVARLRPGDLHQGVLTLAAAQRDIEARNLCANAAHADVLVALHLNSFRDPTAGGAETFYCASRAFAGRSRRLAGLIQADTVTAMRSSGLRVLNRGIVQDTQAGGTPLTPQTANYHHLIELGPSDRPWLPYPSAMPGTLVEPGFLSNPAEAAFVLSPHGQRALAEGLAKALDSYFRMPRPA
jgi:N-acetylmuramoyl-L-alanine amidase